MCLQYLMIIINLIIVFYSRWLEKIEQTYIIKKICIFIMSQVWKLWLYYAVVAFKGEEWNGGARFPVWTLCGVFMSLCGFFSEHPHFLPQAKDMQTGVRLIGHFKLSV